MDRNKPISVKIIQYCKETFLTLADIQLRSYKK